MRFWTNQVEGSLIHVPERRADTLVVYVMAKIASDVAKPDGCRVVPPGTENEFLAPLPVRALWGIGQGYTWIFAILSAVAVVGVLYWLFALGAANSWWLTLSLALIMAGTLGNLYDRLGLHGCIVNGTIKYAVRDFLLFTFGDWNYPVFNFADVFLVTGALMLVVQSFRAEAVSDQPEDQKNQTGSSQPTSTTKQQSSSHRSSERAAMTGGPG